MPLSHQSSLGSNESSFYYETPVIRRGEEARIEVPLGVSEDGTSADAVAVITGPAPERLPYEVLARYQEEKEAAQKTAEGETSDRRLLRAR